MRHSFAQDATIAQCDNAWSGRMQIFVGLNAQSLFGKNQFLGIGNLRLGDLVDDIGMMATVQPVIMAATSGRARKSFNEAEEFAGRRGVKISVGRALSRDVREWPKLGWRRLQRANAIPLQNHPGAGSV
jgi:hypothetical protein